MDLKRAVDTFVHRIIVLGEDETLVKDSQKLRKLLKHEIELVLIRGAIIQQCHSRNEYEAMLIRTFGAHWMDQDVAEVSAENSTEAA